MGEQDMQSKDTTAGSEPVRHQVHHSYIWLGTLRVVLVVFVAVVISMFSSIIGAISEGVRGGGAEVGFVIAITGRHFDCRVSRFHRYRLPRSLAGLQAPVLRPGPRRVQSL